MLIENKPAVALSRVNSLLPSMSVHVVGFERMKDNYSTCTDFGLIYHDVINGNRDECEFYHSRWLFILRD